MRNEQLIDRLVLGRKPALRRAAVQRHEHEGVLFRNTDRAYDGLAYVEVIRKSDQAATRRYCSRIKSECAVRSPHETLCQIVVLLNGLPGGIPCNWKVRPERTEEPRAVFSM